MSNHDREILRRQYVLQLMINYYVWGMALPIILIVGNIWLGIRRVATPMSDAEYYRTVIFWLVTFVGLPIIWDYQRWRLGEVSEEEKLHNNEFLWLTFIPTAVQAIPERFKFYPPGFIVGGIIALLMILAIFTPAETVSYNLLQGWWYGGETFLQLTELMAYFAFMQTLFYLYQAKHL